MQDQSMYMGGIVYKKQGLDCKSYGNQAELLHLIENFNRLKNFDQILAEVGRSSTSLMSGQATIILLCDEYGEELTIGYCSDLINDKEIEKQISINHGLCGWAVTHKLPVIANDIAEKPLQSGILGTEISPYFSLENLICAPLLFDDKVLGIILTLNCHNSQSQKLYEDDLPVFQAFADHAAVAVERGQAWQNQVTRMKEHDVYLTEIHHRVKNDMALMAGIVEVESLDIENKNAKNVLKSIQSRIKSMSVVYELLSTQSSYDKAQVDHYLKELAKNISDSFSTPDKNIDIQVNSESITLDSYKALSCGLIVNELLLNSFKHAFNSQKEGLIEISLTKNENKIMLGYTDNGSGLPNNFKLEDQESIGLQMIHALVNQLDGVLDISNGNGTNLVVRFQAESSVSKQPA